MIRVLLVDDEERVLEVLQKNVHWKECGVDYLFQAENINEALQYYEIYKPDIVITDIEMPDGTGLELIERLRTMNPEVICLCVTCHPEFEYMRKAMQLGSIDYILKPVDYEELEASLKKTIYTINQSRLQDSGSTTDMENVGMNHLFEDEKLVLRAQEYIRQHLSNDLNVQIIAEHLHCSTSHLMHIFKRKTEKTVIEYITDERMNKARQILKESDLPIHMTAKMCGYEDYSYFTRVFKKETGKTPRSYREEYRHH